MHLWKAKDRYKTNLQQTTKTSGQVHQHRLPHNKWKHERSNRNFSITQLVGMYGE